MRSSICLVALVSLAAATPHGTSAAPTYRLVKTVALGAPDGWDFVHFDPSQERVYVAHENEVTVLDARSGKLVGRIHGIAGAHDVAIVPDLGRGYADSGANGDVTVFDLATLRIVGKIPADKDADAMAFDKVSGRIVVGSGDSRDASIIDAAASRLVARVPLGGTAESMVPDGAGNVFINVDTANEVARLNLRTSAIDARWATPGCEAPHGLAFDAQSKRLFASCKNAQMIVLDSSSGARLALLPIGHGTDGAAFDPRRKLAFSSNKDGTLSVIAELGPMRFKSLGDEHTAPGARVMTIDPATGRIFLVTADVSAAHSQNTLGAAPNYDFVPGSVKMMIMDPSP